MYILKEYNFSKLGIKSQALLELQEIKTTEQRPHYKICTHNLQMEDEKLKGLTIST